MLLFLMSSLLGARAGHYRLRFAAVLYPQEQAGKGTKPFVPLAQVIHFL